MTDGVDQARVRTPRANEVFSPQSGFLKMKGPPMCR